ncbi:MAG: efflux RND transporter periplasmic adaptor subunit [Bacteroidota bacterium]
MKKISLITIAAVLIIIIAGLTYSKLYSEDNVDAGNYSLIKVQRRSLNQSVLATGIIKTQVGAEVKVGAQVSGIVKELNVEIGSKVRKGDLLAEIEPTGYRAKMEMALAQKEIAEAEKKFAEKELKRYRALNEKEVATAQQMESIEKQYEFAVAKVEQAKADLDFALLQLSYTKITSPIDGIVASVATQEGETVAASFAAPTFVTIIDLNRLEVWAYVDETDIGRIAPGQTVTFTVDTYPGEEFNGRVETIYPKAEIQNNVVNYVTVINMEKKEGRTIRPEMTATVRIYNDRKDDVLVVPKNAVKKEEGKTFVYVLKNGMPSKKYIETGVSDKKYFEVLSGIKENEKVIAGEVNLNK